MRLKAKNLPCAIRLALVAGALSLAAPVFAQTTREDSEEVKTLDNIVVTGTLASGPGVVANSPISSYSAEDLQRTQTVNVEEFLRLVPGAVPVIGSGTNNGNGGGATIDLRGLGSNRTLVLINGRRLVPFNLTGSADSNTIPIALIDRIDLVTGGASAVYGADAISGVINFILKNNFEGAEIAAQYGMSSEGDGDRQRVDLTLGANVADGRGNVVLSVGKTKTDPVFQGDRPIGEVALSSTTGLPSGSTTAIPAIFTSLPGGLGNRQIAANGSLVPIYETFNFNPVNLFQTPLDRLQATAMGSFNVSDNHQAYAELTYSRTDVGTQLASSGTFLNTYQVPIGNAFMPEPMRQQLCTAFAIAAPDCVVGNTQLISLAIGRRFEELGPRLNDFENKTFQGTVGLRGDLGEALNYWRYDLFYSFGEADQIQTRGNWGSLSRVRQALQAVSTTTCINPANGCIPLNVFGAEGTITPEMLSFINLDALLRQTVEQDVGGGTFTGDLGESFKVPWASFPISVAAGFEIREVSARTKSDSASQIQGEVLGTGAPTPDRSGSFDLKEGFLETFIPLVNDASWAYSLTLEAGYRYTEFNTGASSRSYDTYKYGGEWAPVESFRMRGLAQRATRAPNINELFAPQVSGLSNLAVDPCQGAAINPGQANTPGTLSNLCLLTGVPLGQIGSLPAPSAGQINVLTGGNPNLGPEVADTLTYGVVWEPHFFEKMLVTLDYYRVEVEDAISSPSVTDILSQCYNTAFNPSLSFNAACALVGRNPANGTFNGSDAPGVGLLITNQGKIKTDGIDLGINYQMADYAWGQLSFALSLNKVLGWTFQATPTSVNRDCLGYYSIACGSSIIHEYKSNLRTTWRKDNFDVSLSWRYLSAVDEEPGGTVFLPEFSRISAYNYFDLAGTWRVTDNIRINATIQNLFDKDPPNVGNTIGTTTANSGNTYPQFYDTIGRFYTVGATITF